MFRPIFFLLAFLFLSPHSHGSTPSSSGAETLRQADWWPQVQENIRAMEYEVTWQEDSIVPGGEAAYHVANRAQNLRVYFRDDGLDVVRRTDPEPAWVWRCRPIAAGKSGGSKPLGTASLSTDKNRVEYRREAAVDRYENLESGVRHTVVLPEAPSGTGPLVVRSEVEGLDARLGTSGSELLLLDGGQASLRYGDIMATDVFGRQLGTVLSLEDGVLEISIQDEKAVYPIEVVAVLTGIEKGGVDSEALWTVEGNADGVELGTSVATAGDVNGDGFSDVILGAPGYDNGQTDEGRAFVFYGGMDGLPGEPSWGKESGVVDARFGASVASAGDVNGDGFSDVLVGAPEATAVDPGGRVYLYHGTADGLSQAVNWMARTTVAEAGFGTAAVSAGDVNGDGFSDIAVGAPLHTNLDGRIGAVYVWMGSDTGLGPDGLPSNADWKAVGDDPDAAFGFSLAGAGDVNGDGFSDLVVGEPDHLGLGPGVGRAFAYEGSSEGLGPDGTPTNADWSRIGLQPSSHFGLSVAMIGDFSGDKYADVAVGSPGFTNDILNPNSGVIQVFHGSSAGLNETVDWVAVGDPGSKLGSSVATAGDVNGDGYADLVAGAPYREVAPYIEAGMALLWYGSTDPDRPGGSLGNADWFGRGDRTGGHFGSAVSTAGDVNGDGFSDVLVGSPTRADPEPDGGAASVYYGGPEPIADDIGWSRGSVQTNGQYGFSVASAGDVNGDGFSDVIVGAPLYDAGQTDEGRAFVYHGHSTGLQTSFSWSAQSNQIGAQLGNSVSTAGDYNIDGYDDVLVGAWFFDSGEEDNGLALVWYGSEGQGIQPAVGIPQNAGAVLGPGPANAWAGASVACAGDVDGDGIPDLVIGAPNHGGGFPGEGMILIYTTRHAYGSLVRVAEALPGFGTDVRFGWSVGSAGDVDGDGFSEIIVGSPGSNSGETDGGGVIVFYGSPDGPVSSPAWQAYGTQVGEQLGISVGTAGDVNGDGYSDVIAGGFAYDHLGQTDSGSAYSWYGGPEGLGLNSRDPDWTKRSAREGVRFGWSVGTAGDTNGDGFSEVVIGAPLYENNIAEEDEGWAFVFRGGASGLEDTPAWSGEGDEAGAEYGFSVATAGDVNGDGYADTLVGARRFDGAITDQGGAFLYYGNGGPGRPIAAHARQTLSGKPIPPLGLVDSFETFRVRAMTDSPWGSGRVRLEWEVKPLGVPFDGSTELHQNANWFATGGWLSGTVRGLEADTLYHWRTRTRYHPADSPPQPFGRWVTPPWNGWEEADLRSRPPLSGDVTGERFTNAFDVFYFSLFWGLPFELAPVSCNPEEDKDINAKDALLLHPHWRTGPEP